MKTCVFCQTRLEDSAFRCICGRSLFIADEKHKTYPGPLRQKIMGMLRSSRKRYSEDEISTISFAIMEYCTAEHVGIDDYLISRIADNLDAQVEDEIKRNHDMLLREQQSRTQNTSLRNAPDSSHDSFERSSPFFRSDRSDEVGDNVFIETLADILNLSFIKDIVRFAYRHTGYDYKQYRDNASLWSDIQRGLVREGQRLKLSNFHVTEWIPYAPGRYFLPESVQARAQAQRFFSWSRREYLPLGKRDMIIGGIGSVRLKARVIDGQQYYFIGASSTGISHQGIPLIVNDSEYRSVADCLIANGGCCANINGRLKVMPPEISIIHYSKNIPKYFVHVSRIELLRPSPPDILLVTPSVLYSGSDYYYDDARSKYFELDGIKSEFRKGWAFCSFNPSDGVHAINAAAEWLNNYAKRYSETESDPILSDFDEHTQHFESPIEFPLKEILDSQINMRRLGIYGNHYNFHIIGNEITMGNIFSNISNSTIINESQIRDSFRKVSLTQDEETAQAILRLAEEIDRSGNRSAATLFNTFNTELQKDVADPQVLRTLWKGITEQLPAINKMVDIVKNVTSLFT